MRVLKLASKVAERGVFTNVLSVFLATTPFVLCPVLIFSLECKPVYFACIYGAT